MILWVDTKHIVQRSHAGRIDTILSLMTYGNKAYNDKLYTILDLKWPRLTRIILKNKSLNIAIKKQQPWLNANIDLATLKCLSDSP